jgi:hypothetical protein
MPSDVKALSSISVVSSCKKKPDKLAVAAVTTPSIMCVSPAKGEAVLQFSVGIENSYYNASFIHV